MARPHDACGAGIKDASQNAIFKVLAAILHLGNIEINADRGGESCHVSVSTRFGFIFGFASVVMMSPLLDVRVGQIFFFLFFNSAAETMFGRKKKNYTTNKD